jgi:cytochrome c biogenesis protein CcmG, thiol:disulfide interchange protein DsbE
MNRARNAAIGVGVLLVGLIALFAVGGPSGEDDGTSRLLGRRVPALVGTTLEGADYDIDRSRGRWVLVNFFASWCPPCIAEHPDLVELEEWGRTEGRLDLVSVVFDDEPDQVRALFDELGGSWPVVQAPGAVVDFQIRKVPESFLVAPDGVVVAHVISGIESEWVIDEIEKAEQP